MRHCGSLVLALAALLLGCGPSIDTKVTAILGGLLIDGTGVVPVSDSVVLVVGGRIRAAGPRTLVPVPQGSDQVDGRGKFIVPGLVDLYAKPAPAGAFLRYGVTTAASAGGAQPPPASSSPQIHWFASPLTGISTLAAVQQDLEVGQKRFLGVMLDTGNLDQPLLARLRNLGAVFAPMLVRLEGQGELLARAEANTGRLAAVGVRIGLASGGASGGTALREIELLAQAGLTPMQAIVAATGTGGVTLARPTEIGTLEPGRRADLLVLTANPLEDVRNLRKLERVMLDGEWVAR